MDTITTRLATLCLCAAACLASPASAEPLPAGEAEAFLQSPEIARLRKGAEGGDPVAMVMLGDAIGQKLDPAPGSDPAAERLRWYELAAEQDYPLAFYRMGIAALKGEGMEANRAAALRWFEKGAAHDEPGSILAAAQLHLASAACTDCRSEPEENEALSLEEAIDAMAEQPAEAGADHLARAISLLKKPAVEANPQARRLLVKAYLSGANPRPQGAAAAALLETMARAGDGWAAALLGSLHLAGAAGVPQDGARADKYLTIAAENGNGAAAARLGDQLMIGKLIPRDPERALALFERADALGHSGGTLSLGMMYRGGYAVQQDDAKAIALVERAARSGNALAATQAAKIWEEGVGGKSDPVKARYWRQKAAEFRGKASEGPAARAGAETN